MGKKQSQRQKRRAGHPPPLTKQQIAAIAAKIEKGELTLPELKLDHDSDYVAVWALVDSGSSVHVVDVAKVFPGAHVDKPPEDHKGFTCAGGTTIPHKGTTVVPFKSTEGNSAAVKWKNAEVAMPILSTHELARNGRSVEYQELGGKVKDPKNNASMNFIMAHDVYFMKMLIPKAYTEPPRSADQDFGRPGKI